MKNKKQMKNTKLHKLQCRSVLVAILFGSCLGAFGVPTEKKEKKVKEPINADYPFIALPAGKVYADTTLAPEDRAAAVVKEMTFEEKANSLGGFTKFFSPRIERLGIRPLYFSDASQGVHIRTQLSSKLDKSTSFPCTLALAATWDPMLAGAYASAIGEQCRAGDIAVLLGPGLNIYRSSECGRNFEYMGEDPLLVGQMASAYVKGIQSVGTMATLKHFICNDTEVRRCSIDAVVSERALHEIYVPAFKKGIEAGAGGVMTAYNALNGQYCSQSKYVNTDLLRGELGFKGLIMTDWAPSSNQDDYMASGSDLFMPWFRFRPRPDQEKDMDRMITQWLTPMFKMGFYDRPQFEPELRKKFPEHEQVALKTAQDSIVLLKNSSNLLPIDCSKYKSILVVGKAADNIYAGGGSGNVPGYDAVKLLAALKKEFGEKIKYEIEPTEESIKAADLVIATVALKSGEASDRPFELEQDLGRGLALKCASLNPNTVMVANVGGGFSMADCRDKVNAIVFSLYAGQMQGTAIVDVLTGRVNPSGKLPFTIEKEFSDSPASVYPITLGGENNKPPTPTSKVEYKEGVFVGYRWYESKKIEPLFPFGFGLSYTTFKYDDLKLSSTKLSGDDVLKVSFTITNTGKVAGAEVAQLYVQPTQSSVPRPVKELKGFKKVMLKPGESAQVELSVNRQDLSFWDETSHSWKAEPGKFNILVGSSSTDVRLSGEFELVK